MSLSGLLNVGEIKMVQTAEWALDAATVPELVLAAQDGDRAAMGELFTRYHRHVLAVGRRRLRSESEAQELCQDVFLQAIQKIRQLRDPRCFGGWLRSIAQRMAVNRVTRRDPAVSAEAYSLEVVAVDSRTPLAAAVEQERASQVNRGLRQLRALDRDTLVAFYVHGQSLLEMSDKFDAPVGTIKRRLHVARQRLAKEVEPLVSV